MRKPFSYTACVVSQSVKMFFIFEVNLGSLNIHMMFKVDIQ